jgi:small subunit ribosomal protein S17
MIRFGTRVLQTFCCDIHHNAVWLSNLTMRSARQCAQSIRLVSEWRRALGSVGSISGVQFPLRLSPRPLTSPPQRLVASAAVVRQTIPAHSIDRVSLLSAAMWSNYMMSRNFSSQIFEVPRNPVDMSLMKINATSGDTEDFSQMSNEELMDTSSIPGWHLIHNPPRKFPPGALVGTVVSDKMMKTVNVAVDRYRIVPKIRKRMRYTRKFMAHDENEVAAVGDLVMITPCHRISKHKHFMLREIIRTRGQL